MAKPAKQAKSAKQPPRQARDKQRKYVQTKGPTKTFQKDGHWVEKTKVTPILICKCGTRYIKTRSRQTSCLRCMADAKQS